MNFLSIPAIDFDSLGSQHLIRVAPTTAQPKQPLANQWQPFDQNGIGKKLQSGCQWLLGLCCGWSNLGQVSRPYKVKIYGWKGQKVHQGHHFI